MKLLSSIITALALAQGTIAALCEHDKSYCGRDFKKFDNAGQFSIQDDYLYYCTWYRNSLSSQNGRVTLFEHEPILVAPCQKGCFTDGKGKRKEYCGGESLLTRDERLAPCADKAYSNAAKRLNKAEALVDELKVSKNLYGDLLVCLNVFSFGNRVGASDELIKELDDLNALLYKEHRKARDMYFEEYKKYCAAGGLDNGLRCEGK
ncbi:hypothetical protein N7492_008218 [Penicillium capsulatum]|uniref:Uncharacterized protein n=1 Tax=Penicillium capsulatum TaxID=69766 RepID=A0A9W9HSL7_9EURO|nr:hypothetical protein N7492_008218 [Penicillium capsulatum]KAJ6105628.1 hypothetical protein N7512_009145 [Penicillium capsulatum]